MRLRKEKQEKSNELSEHKTNKAKFLAETKHEIEKLRVPFFGRDYVLERDQRGEGQS